MELRHRSRASRSMTWISAALEDVWLRRVPSVYIMTTYDADDAEYYSKVRERSSVIRKGYAKSVGLVWGYKSMANPRTDGLRIFCDHVQGSCKWYWSRARTECLVHVSVWVSKFFDQALVFVFDVEQTLVRVRPFCAFCAFGRTVCATILMRRASTSVVPVRLDGLIQIKVFYGLKR